MKTEIIIIAVAIIVAVVSAILIAKFRASRPQPTPVVGALYSTNPDEDEMVGVIKVLAIDRDGVHVSMYRNKFHRRPANVEEAALEFGTIQDSDPPGIMHVPLSNAAFTRLGPIFIQQSSVTSEELDPIKDWLGGGGYWP